MKKKTIMVVDDEAINLRKRRVMAFMDLQTRQSSQSDEARSRFYSAVNPNQASKPCLSAR